MTLDEYLGLVTSWHSLRPRFMWTLAALLQPMVDAQTMLAQLTADFDLDTAVGVQLDMVGQWIGRSRYIEQPIAGVYFAFDNYLGPRVGFDQGVWFGPYDTVEGIKALDNATYRTVLRLQAIANHWDGTLPSIQAQFDGVFPGSIIQDRGDVPGGLMSMDVIVNGALLSSLLLAVLEQDFMLKPSGVHVNFIESSVPLEPIFAFDLPLIAGGPFGGFDQAAWGEIVFSI